MKVKNIQLTEDWLNAEKMLIEKGLLETDNLYDVENTGRPSPRSGAQSGPHKGDDNKHRVKDGKLLSSSMNLYRLHDGRPPLVKRLASSGEAKRRRR
jgi:preprotein translocase subunit SecA